MTPDIVIEDPAWDAVDLPALAARAGDAVAARMGLEDWEFTCLACDDARITALNADFRGKPRPTNVLSWPSAERGADTPGGIPAPPTPDMFGDRHLGDIALAWGLCRAEAETGGIFLDHHLTHLLIHAILHLLGYDHETDSDAALMEGLETETLATLGIPDPYRKK